MSKHTPGPFYTYGQTVTGPHGVSLAFCGESSVFGQGYSYSTDKKECRANAVLFAAAPDLLEALERLLADYQALSDSGDAGFLCIEGHPVGKAAYAAIARAKGEGK